MNSANNPAIARTIIDQLSARRGCLSLLGAKNLLDNGHGLQFKIGRNVKRVTHITIDLAADDTYTVKFSRVPTVKALCKGAEVVTLAELDGVYVDSLHATIEQHTGLFTSL
jgi:hypothetical protein